MQPHLPRADAPNDAAYDAAVFRCRACGNPMQFVRTAWRGLQVDAIDIYECRPCGVSLSHTPGAV